MMRLSVAALLLGLMADGAVAGVRIASMALTAATGEEPAHGAVTVTR